jgi:hypothetical protein
MHRRPRLNLGYNKRCKIDVYCYFLTTIECATEMEVAQPPFGTIPQTERPLLDHCFGDLDPVYDPFKALLRDIDLKTTTKSERHKINSRLRKYYESQDVLPAESWRRRDRPSRERARRARRANKAAAINTEMDVPSAHNLIMEWESGRADYAGICEKDMADKVVAAYQVLGKRVPPSDLVRQTASKISANYYDSDPSMVVEWQEWQARAKLQPTVEGDTEQPRSSM